MDVELDEETKTIRYATNPSAVGILEVRRFVGDEVRLFNGVHLLKSDEEAAEFLLAPFFM